MTLIVGFPIDHAVVLGADGEEGTDIHKASVRKIESLKGVGYQCWLAGAGDSNFIDLAIQEAREAIAELNPPTLADIRETLEYVVTDIYTERIDKLPEREAERARFELLCANWVEKDQRAELVKVGRGYHLVRNRPDVLGMGDYLASYLIETLGQDIVTRRQAERLAVYILAKAKAHVQSCGGRTQLIYVSDNGKTEEVPQFVITEDEIASDVVMSGARFLFQWTDIIGWRGNLQKINEVVEGVAVGIKQGFQNRYDQLTAHLKQVTNQPAPLPPKDDPQSPPPSQG